MTSGKFLCGLFLLVVPLLSLAQSSGFLSYSVADGLAQSNVVDIAEDQLGNLWLATSAGLSKFDGHEFENFTKRDGLINNQVQCLTVDNKGGIWVGTSQGISYFDGRDFKNYTLDSLQDANQGVKLIFADSQDRVWLVMNQGPTYYIDAAGRFHRPFILVDEFITSIVEKDQKIWMISNKDRLYHYSDTSIYLHELNIDPQLVNIHTMLVDRKQDLWLGAESGLYRYQQGKLERVHQWHQPGGPVEVYSMAEDHQGIIWLGTSRGGFRFDGNNCYRINARNGFTDNLVYKVFSDREDNVWFGTFGRGLLKSLGTTFLSVDAGMGMTYDYVSDISLDRKGGYWFGTYGGGMYHYEPAVTETGEFHMTNFSTKEGLSNNFVFSNLVDDSGRLWIGTADGLNMYYQGSFTAYHKKDGLPSNTILSAFQSRKGEIYFGTTLGLSQRQKDGSFKNYRSQEGAAEDHRIRAIVENEDGNLWLGTLGGLKVFDGQGIRPAFDSDSLNHLGVAAMHLDSQSRLWLGLVDGGVACYNLTTGAITQLGQADGLSSSVVYAIVTDLQGYLWVGTAQGLDRLSFKLDGSLDQIKFYGKQEGFSGIEVNTNATLLESDGSIWFGTVKGAFKCNLKNDKVNLLEPITVIRGIDLHSQPVDWKDQVDSTYSSFALPYRLTLGHQDNHLTFHFFGNSLQNPERVKYQYMLENFDKNWLPITQKDEAVYSNLPAGNYTFKVKACNNEGIWNREPTSFAFTITPPFWSTWWFYTTILALIFVVGRIYYKSRIKKQIDQVMERERIKQEETVKVRKRVASDFHDQVGNQLASITVLVQLIKAKFTGSNHEVQGLLTKLGQFSKSLFTGTKDFVWSIDPKSDHFDEMLIYIKDFGEELFQFSDIDFHVDTNGSFDHKIILPVGWSRHVVFILKEGLTNCLKHAECNNVYMNVEVNQKSFMLELADDGKGLNGHSEDSKTGMGLSNMKDRANKIKSEITFSSFNGQGTKIVLKGKIPQNGG